MGYTQGERNSIYALKPAPVQVLYKGFVGSLGATYVQAMLSDRVLTPPEHAHHLSEKVALMPLGTTYVVNNYVQQEPEFAPSEADLPIDRDNYGLPEDTFIYACFNQQYKIDPQTLKSWVSLLKRRPRSVLWLLRFGTSSASEAALGREAKLKGLSDGRMMFTDTFDRNIHLHVKALADAFLDTPSYNGHGTATDALWASLPVLTAPGLKMSARAAASLAMASAAPDSVARNMKDYEDIATALAGSRGNRVLRRWRSRMQIERDSSPVFDMPSWVDRF